MASDQSLPAAEKFTFKRDIIRVDLLDCLGDNATFFVFGGESKELKLHLNFTFKENDLQAYFTLEKSPYFCCDNFIWYEIFLLDICRRDKIRKKGYCKLTIIGEAKHFVNICTKNYILEPKNSLLHDGMFYISVKSRVGVYPDTKLPKPAKELSLERENLLDYYKNLYDESKDSDIILAVGSKEIQAHKSILALRSPVFRAMFSSSFKEATNNRVEITDMDPDVLEDLIRFIYTSECPSIEEKPMELLAAADKYDIESLRLICEEVLSEQLDKDNAIDLLLLADRHSATALKEKALEIIRHDNIIDQNKINLIFENAERLKELLIE